MKNLIKYFVVLFFCQVNAQYLNIPDINFKNKLLMANYSNSIALDQFNNNVRIDINNDSEIQPSELNIVRTLDVSHSNISNLSGIQYCINLRNLHCENNSISTLNLTTLTNLIHLESQNNNLTNINIAGLAALEYFNCSNNQLINLIFAGNTYLNKLFCNNNLLTNLNVSNSTHLYWVHCSNNQISNLNCAGSYNIDQLICNNNLLNNNLNLTAFTNLFRLDCSFNQISSLTVSGLSVIEEIYCSYNNLTSLNLSGLTELRILDCSFNQLINNNLIFSQNNLLRELYCENNLLADLTLIMNGSHLAYLNRIRCDNNQLLNLNINSPTLRYLTLTGNPNLNIVILDTPSLFGTLDVSNRQLTTFSINNGYFLYNVFCNNNLLTSITALNMHTIGEFNCNNNQLNSLTLSGLNYNFGDSGSGLKRLNCSNNLLTTLNLYGTTNYYGVELNCNQNLFTSLDFSDRRIKTIDFGNNPNITSINLKNNYSETAVWLANTPNILLFCEDANQVTEMQAAVNFYGYTGCTVNSTCTLNNSNFDLSNSVKIYPNPSKNILTIDTNVDLQIKDVIIYNPLGQIVLFTSSSNKEIDVSKLKSGTYFMEIISNEIIIKKGFVKL